MALSIFDQKTVRDSERDLTDTREAGFTKIQTQDARFFCLSVGNSRNRHDSNTRNLLTDNRKACLLIVEPG